MITKIIEALNSQAPDYKAQLKLSQDVNKDLNAVKARIQQIDLTTFLTK